MVSVRVIEDHKSFLG